MHQYLAKRILLSIPILFLITVLNFSFIHLAPGDPVLMLMSPDQVQYGQEYTPRQLEELRARYGLDKPWPVQYLNWLTGLAQGNFGISLRSRLPVGPLLLSRIGPTVKLMSLALLISVVVGVGAGVLSAVRQYSVADYLSTSLSFIAVSVPNFFLALIAIYIFALKLKWLPTSGMKSIGVDNTGFFDAVRYLVLPSLVLGLSSAAGLVRYTRSSLLEVLRLDYVTTARAKGLAERRVVFVHALRNALLPVITIISLSLPSLFGGSVVIESVFNYPGIGSFAVQAVFSKDYPIIMAVNLISSVLVLAANLVADLAYAVADPRIRYA